MSREQALREAEDFVRRAMARASDAPVDEEAVRAAAQQIVKVVPPYAEESEQEAVAA